MARTRQTSIAGARAVHREVQVDQMARTRPTPFVGVRADQMARTRPTPFVGVRVDQMVVVGVLAGAACDACSAGTFDPGSVAVGVAVRVAAALAGSPAAAALAGSPAAAALAASPAAVLAASPAAAVRIAAMRVAGVPANAVFAKLVPKGSPFDLRPFAYFLRQQGWKRDRVRWHRLSDRGGCFLAGAGSKILLVVIRAA